MKLVCPKCFKNQI